MIEDLNEEGFPDPKNPGPFEVPLILNRLAPIEDLAPCQMDAGKLHVRFDERGVETEAETE